MSQKNLCVAFSQSRQICRPAPNIKGGVSAMGRLWRRCSAKPRRNLVAKRVSSWACNITTTFETRLCHTRRGFNGLIVSNASNTTCPPRFARLGIFVTTGVTFAFVTEHPLNAVPAYRYAIQGGCRAKLKPGSASRRRVFLVASERRRYALLLMSR
jgi:hypothetical protein